MYLARYGQQFDQPIWHLIDWTNPVQRSTTGTYLGTGSNDAEAIRHALDVWAGKAFGAGNRYPRGVVLFDVEASQYGPHVVEQFDSDGGNAVDSVAKFFEYVGFGTAILAGVITLLAPEPTGASKVVSGLIWTSILSSTAGAVINIGQRHAEGFGNWRDDAFDVLTIVGNAFGAGGMVWRRGAQMTIRTVEGKVFKGCLLGQLGTDAVQGVLISEDGYESYQRIMDDESLTPEQRTNKLLELFRGLAVAGTMTAISMTATKMDLDNLGKGRTNGRFEDLKDPTKRLDITEDVKVAGKTQEKEVRVTAQDEQLAKESPRLRAPGVSHPVVPEETAFAKRYKADDPNLKKRRLTPDGISLEDVDGFSFDVHFHPEDNSIDVSIFTAEGKGEARKVSKHLRANELFPLAYAYFDELGTPVQKWKGIFVQENYAAARVGYDAAIRAGKSEEEACKEAIRSAKTYKYHAKEGLTKIVEASHAPDSFFSFEVERQ